MSVIPEKYGIGKTEPRTGRVAAVILTSVILLTACATSHPLFDTGLEAFNRNNFRTAYVSWIEAAKDGDADSQHSLGWLYENGSGVARNYIAASYWYKLSAAQGLGGAQLNLGNLYDNGLGVEKNYEEAARLYLAAAEKGFAEAQNNIGVMYFEGHGVEQSYGEAAKWLDKAAERGVPAAQNRLGVMYFKGLGVEKDHEKALFWLELAVRRGQPGAVQNRDFARSFLNVEQVDVVNSQVGMWYPY